MATSSTEAEISALMKICSEIEFYKNMLEEILQIQTNPVPVWCDNQPAVEIANGARGAARTMLYGIRYGAVQEAVKRRIVSVSHIPGIENTADVFTKALEKTSLRKILIEIPFLIFITSFSIGFMRCKSSMMTISITPTSFFKRYH